MSRYSTGLIRHFAENRRGNIAITFGMLLLPIVGVIGSAVDFGRAVHAQSKMQTAADTAATTAAAALTLTDSQRQQLAREFFAQNNAGTFGASANVEPT